MSGEGLSHLSCLGRPPTSFARPRLEICGFALAPHCFEASARDPLFFFTKYQNEASWNQVAFQNSTVVMGMECAHGLVNGSWPWVWGVGRVPTPENAELWLPTGKMGR